MASQNFVEFWSVATRPVEVNGMGLDPEQAERLLARLESVFDLLPEPPTVHAIWRQLVIAHRVRGRQVHDARLVAVMLANGISHILTFNVSDFARYPGIVAIDPRDFGGSRRRKTTTPRAGRGVAGAVVLASADVSADVRRPLGRRGRGGLGALPPPAAPPPPATTAGTRRAAEPPDAASASAAVAESASGTSPPTGAAHRPPSHAAHHPPAGYASPGRSRPCTPRPRGW